MKTFWKYLGFALLVSLVLLIPRLSHAQTLSVVYKGDSVLAIAKYSCSTACADSNRIVWLYGGQRYPRNIAPKKTDTLRVAALSVNDSVWVDTDPFKSTRKAAFVRGYVPPAPPVVAPPVIAPPVTPPASIPTNTNWAQPIAPATFALQNAPVVRSIPVASGSDLQAALNAAQSGDELVLADNGVWIGNFAYSGKGAVSIRCATVLPGPRMPVPSCRVETRNTEAAFRTNGSASNLRVVGLELAHNPTAPQDSTIQNYGIVVLGRGDENTFAAMPSDITLDRVWVHSAGNMQTRRCVAFNGARLAIINSWLSDCHSKGFDTQGVGGWNGPGPFLIEGNHIEASGQGVMFGGADPRIRDVSPSDIIIRRNHIFKPLTWTGTRWQVKAAFEIKHGRRVLFEGNVIQNHWAHAQNGFAVLLQGLSDNNTAWEWTAVTDVMIRDNRIINSTSGANLLSRVAYNGGQMLTTPMQRVAIVNNWWEGVGKDPFRNESSMAVQLLNDLTDVTIANNTFTCSCSMAKALSFDGKPQVRTTIVDNVFPVSTYILTGNATATGKWTLDVFAPGASFLRNNLPGARPQDYNAGALGGAAGADTLKVKAATAGVVR